MKRSLIEAKIEGLVSYMPCNSTTVKDLITGITLSADGAFKVVSNDNPFGGSCLTKSSSGDGGYYFTPPYDMLNGDYTICAWFKSTTNGNGGIRVLAEATTECYCRYGYNAMYSSGRPCWLLNTAYWGTTISSSSYINSKWNHYEFSKSGNTYILFVNGAKIATKTYSGTTPGNQFRIFGQYGQYFCHVSIWNKILHTSDFTTPTKPY